jgi:hypothetical protein
MMGVMAKRKNPAAVALGRLGGKKTGRKGLAAMTDEQREAIRAKSLEKRRAKKTEN